MYATVLTPKGKFLHDLFISRHPGGYAGCVCVWGVPVVGAVTNAVIDAVINVGSGSKVRKGGMARWHEDTWEGTGTHETLHWQLPSLYTNLPAHQLTTVLLLLLLPRSSPLQTCLTPCS